jgi:hypothetical protein
MIDPRRIEVIDDQTAQIMRRMSGAQRLRAAGEMREAAERMLTAHLQASNPQWSVEEVCREVLRRLAQQS